LGPEIDYWGFTIEKKLYTTSPDSCKIDCMEHNADRINQWLENLMKTVKPIPRFTLKKYGYQGRLSGKTSKA